MTGRGRGAWVLAIGFAAAAAAIAAAAPAPDDDGVPARLAEAAPAQLRAIGGAVDVLLRFVPEDGPASGHVRVLLTPETRPLGFFEARSAAQQAFLEALREPGLGDVLTRITVVVRLSPEPEGGGAQQSFLFLRKSDRDWTVLPGD